jgi:hypothetical protein
MKLVCPKCGSGDDLATLERTPGSALINGIRIEDAHGTEPRPVIDWFGETKMWWDGQEPYGIECRACEWSWFLGDDEATAPLVPYEALLAKLRPEGDHDRS